MYAYQRGDLLPVAFQPVGQSQSYKASIKGYTLDRVVALFDTTHTGHAGAGTARIAGKSDATGNITLSFDADVPPYLLPPNQGVPQGAGPSSLQAASNTTFMEEGVSGILLVFVTPNKPIQVPIVWGKTGYKSAVDGHLEWNADYSMNVNVGLYVRPTTPGA